MSMLKEGEGGINRYLCIECGSGMKKVDDFVLVCSNCLHSVDILDYENEEELYKEIFGINDNVHCIDCDGPWPLCISSCKLYNQ